MIIYQLYHLYTMLYRFIFPELLLKYSSYHDSENPLLNTLQYTYITMYEGMTRPKIWIRFTAPNQYDNIIIKT